MVKFIILVSCISESFAEIEVEAANEKEAKKRALVQAETGKIEFTEIDSMYTCEKADQLPPTK